MIQGIETLGVFHPHWLSASADSQRDLISRYIYTLSRNSPKAQQKFQSALGDAQPTDVAAVLKWGLRHLVIEDGTFGKKSAAGNDGWGWYIQFVESERKASFPTDAFSKQLIPLLPSVHATLLTDLLGLFSSVAAHAQANGMFNTKLCKTLAWWIVSSRKWDHTDSDAWKSFYEAWDRSARILEHIMLAYLRFVKSLLLAFKH